MVVRKDLTAAQQAVQAAHAAMEAVKQFGLTEWVEHPHLVLCGADSLEHLLRCSSFLESREVAHCVWREPDLNNEPTALSTSLLSGGARRHLRKFSLL